MSDKTRALLLRAASAVGIAAGEGMYPHDEGFIDASGFWYLSEEEQTLEDFIATYGEIAGRDIWALIEMANGEAG